MAEKVDQMDPDEKIVEIAIEQLRVFENHPFRVEMDSQMKDLQDSIKKYRIITPVIVRPRKEGYYEIISGHRRIFAAEKLGYRKVPTIIRYMTDDQAVIAMVDSNLQRERISLGYEEPDEMEYSLATLMMNVVNDEKLNIEKTILHHKEGVGLFVSDLFSMSLPVLQRGNSICHMEDFYIIGLIAVSDLFTDL